MSWRLPCAPPRDQVPHEVWRRPKRGHGGGRERGSRGAQHTTLKRIPHAAPIPLKCVARVSGQLFFSKNLPSGPLRSPSCKPSSVLRWPFCEGSCGSFATRDSSSRPPAPTQAQSPPTHQIKCDNLCATPDSSTSNTHIPLFLWGCKIQRKADAVHTILDPGTSWRRCVCFGILSPSARALSQTHE